MQQKTRIAVVGFGLVGKQHANVLRQHKDLSLCAIVEPTASGKVDACAMGVSVFDDLRKL